MSSWDLNFMHQRCICMFVRICSRLKKQPFTAEVSVSLLFRGLQTVNSSLESTVCHYRQHVEAELTPGHHQSQYLETGSTHVRIQAPKSHTDLHTTVSKPITAAHYWAGQVQVLTRATINPPILSGLLVVHSEQLTSLNVRAVASLMRQDNCAVFQPEQVSTHWPWWYHSTSRFTSDQLCLESPGFVSAATVAECHR